MSLHGRVNPEVTGRSLSSASPRVPSSSMKISSPISLPQVPPPAAPAVQLLLPPSKRPLVPQPAVQPGSSQYASTSGRKAIVPSSTVLSAAAPSATQVQQPTLPSQSEGLYDAQGAPYIYLQGQRVHSLHARGKDVMGSLDTWAGTDLLRFLKPVEKSWQPQDFLPDPASPDFYDQVTELRTASAQLPFDYMVVLVGDMVTEEALPSYMNMLNTLDGAKDETGAQPHGWATWTRQWTGEENRHGDLLNKYLYLSGRVNMQAVESTIQRLIGSGLDPKLENNPYLCFVYTSFQERATKISHGNTARLASYYGDNLLTKICGVIAADESRHEAAYTNIVDQLFQRDPEGALLAFADMMRKGIVMPAHYVDDGVHSDLNPSGNLFVDYAAVADNIGVYTTNDYANIVEHLVNRWGVLELTGLSGSGAAAQEFLAAHPSRIRRLANIQAERRLRDRKRGKTKEASFSWVRGRQVPLQ